MSKFTINLLTQENAEIIADKWKYPGEYSFYDMTEDPEDYEEIVDPKQRKDNYFQVLRDGELIGFFCLNWDDSKMELGLGMKPELCGRGNGNIFMREVEEYIRDKYSIKSVSLSVAEFNKRAIKLYENMGYVPCGKEEVATNGGKYMFINMVKKF